MNWELNNRLIVNADDFGYKSSINKAIIKSFESGLINSITIMANMPGFEEAIDLLHAKNINKNIGVHLVLTEGNPITDEIKKFDFLFKGNLNFSIRLKKLFYLRNEEKKAIFNEYSAQIEKVRKCNINITHLDTHHQIHDMWAIMQIMIELLKTFNIPSMRILNNLEVSKSNYKNIYRNSMNYLLRKKKVNFSRYMGDQQDFLLALKKKPKLIEKGTIEVMVHPDYCKEEKLIDRIENNEYNLDFLPDNLKNKLIANKF